MKNARKRYMLWGGLIAAPIVLVVCFNTYTDRKAREAELRFPPVGQFVDAGGTRLHYLSKGSGTPVVFIHGSDGILQDFTETPVFDKVAERHRAIAFDRPGHGYSGRPMNEPLTLATNARLIHNALARLGVDKAVFVGHSYGGSVVLKYALEYPRNVSGMVLLAPPAYPLGLNKVLFSLTEIPLIGPLVSHTLLIPIGTTTAHFTNTRSFLPDPVPADDQETMDAFMLRPQQFKAFVEEMKVFDQGLQELGPRYSEIRAPTVIVVGDSDQIIKPENNSYLLHRAIPHSKLMVLKNAGHEIIYTRPDEVQVAISQVISQVNN